MQGKFKLEIELGNEAMQDRYSLANALRKLALELEIAEPETGSVLDRNGNSVGHWEITSDDDRLIAAAPDMVTALEDVESKIVDYEAGRINWRPDDFLFRVRAAIRKARGD